MVYVREGRPAEAAELTALALRSKAHWGYDEGFMAACREELAVRPADVTARRTAVAERDGRILGFTMLDGAPPEGALGMMFVEPDAIGQGVGRLLFGHAREQARRLGFTLLTIDADPNAEPFYTAMGAVRVGAVPSGSVPGRMLPLLELALT
ncbi:MULTISPECIES: GNAT family N-acetyltransferase [unclassified Streptomyces]|uniref:GNAT family N-acetyltransferase n=2 Tax=Streptomyces TaxID=1883 RepID=UPI0001C1CBB2|nr:MULTISPECIES: GNAT family N-acetyltransferase [unclassified Streptomyces]AEN09959.1 GCN5-related N-acetyltransferase [Streptomyces sp. SirexAA-E]MYR66433.1 GNAT family N-acetyltransferase [Streptomyces sp. SID4939]MYT64185.1 GNAT family N-acetyltransferase [Streptomyces sp. SID8357]MYT86998.1 GNAT family N-acetyltransferase [Streptomyces sp. SID8360]MYU34453.1 GNAT family N-acetyltransferase [Streptomyces sp. SID8358]